MPNPYNLTIGQKLWYVPGDTHFDRPREYEIVKIGRQWAQLGADGQAYREFRADLETLAIDGHGYSSPGRCYLSLEAYEAEVGLSVAWRSFQRDIERMRAADPQITIENIAAARKVLGMGEKL